MPGLQEGRHGPGPAQASSTRMPNLTWNGMDYDELISESARNGFASLLVYHEGAESLLTLPCCKILCFSGAGNT